MNRILVASICSNGKFPCHRCLVCKTKADLSKLGAPDDKERITKQRSEEERNRLVNKARVEIFENGYAIDGTKVEDYLKDQSLIPVQVCPLWHWQPLCTG